MNHCCKLIASGLFAFMFSATLTADDLAMIEKQIGEKLRSHRSLAYNSLQTERVALGEMEIESRTENRMLAVQEADRWMTRSEAKSVMFQRSGGEETVKQIESVFVIDGEHMFSLTDTMGDRVGTKRKFEPGRRHSPFDAAANFAAMREQFNLKALPSETLDGKAMFVIEGSPVESGTQLKRMVTYFRQDNGLMYKSVGFGHDGAKILELVVTKAEIDIPIEPSMFKLEFPPDVPVNDMTQKRE